MTFPSRHALPLALVTLVSIAACGGTLNLTGTLRRIAIDPAGRGAIIADEAGRVVIVK